MRLAVVLASLTVGALIQSALAADPPEAAATPGKVASEPVQAPAPAATTATPPVSASSTSAPATALSTTRAVDDSDAARLEQRMHARGFMTRMQNGEKIFCRREQVLGTRLGGALHCMHEDEARADEDRLQGDEERQRQRMMGACVPSGSVGGKQTFSCGG